MIPPVPLRLIQSFFSKRPKNQSFSGRKRHFGREMVIFSAKWQKIIVLPKNRRYFGRTQLIRPQIIKNKPDRGGAKPAFLHPDSVTMIIPGAKMRDLHPEWSFTSVWGAKVPFLHPERRFISKDVKRYWSMSSASCIYWGAWLSLCYDKSHCF